MSPPGPDVSVVFETENEAPNHRIRLTDVMEAWLRQTGRSGLAEWIIVSPRRASPEEAEILRKAPARWIESPETRYYGLKNEGILQARGGRFQQHAGEPRVNPLKDFIGRMRLLISRWRALRRPLGIPFWRLPLSLFFFGLYSTAVAHGLELAHRGRPEPFARF